jgi:predicted type IV restriction endonuclease
MAEYDACRSEMEKLVSWYEQNKANRNEAATRLHIIDTLLFDCLGWNRKQDCEPEDALRKEYADYILKTNRRYLVVEAKREGDQFEVPLGKLRLEYSLPSLCKDAPNLAEAVEQAAGYAQRRGIPFAAVSNGHQLVAFVASRDDGVGPAEGKALVFPSLELMSKHFLDLWQTLSRDAIEKERLRLRLVRSTGADVPAKLSAQIGGYPGVQVRNDFKPIYRF